MPGIARVGLDTAGGLITGNLEPNIRVNGYPVAVVGTAVASHGTGAHASATMAAGSSVVRANGIAVCRAGDAATCGDLATGDPKISAG